MATMSSFDSIGQGLACERRSLRLNILCRQCQGIMTICAAVQIPDRRACRWGEFGHRLAQALMLTGQNPRTVLAFRRRAVYVNGQTRFTFPEVTMRVPLRLLVPLTAFVCLVGFVPD